MEKILVWDWPVRIGHWLLVAMFGLAWLSGESETWRYVHAWSGGAVVALIIFRLLWGLVGTRHARFASFVRGPAAAVDYVKSLFSSHSGEQYAGHNAAGAWAIMALLALGLLSGASGWLIYQDGFELFAEEFFEELHEVLASLMLLVAGVHLAGVVVSSLAHRENLPRAMVTGMKTGRQDEAITSARPLVAVLMLIWVVVCAWWLAS